MVRRERVQVRFGRARAEIAVKRRILVLGGGCAGIAAAWALTRSDALRQRFDVTVFQHGHRLGGKGATGRDPSRGDAVLEHGLHLWLGFYEQAFGMMRDIYEHWDAPAAGPQRTIDTAFRPIREVALMGGTDDAPEYWRMRFPELPGRPWDPPLKSAPRFVRMARRWLQVVRESMRIDGTACWTKERLPLVASLASAVVTGLTREWSRHGAHCWDAMDELDLRAWLRAHGASHAAVDSPIVRALYDLGFAYPDGRPGPSKGAIAAGSGLRALLKILGGYRGAPFWRMTAGMGDTVFAPAYEVLQRRGVRFRFFHRVDALRVHGSGIARVELGVQARLRSDDYEPLVQVGRVRAWPNLPKRDSLLELADGDLEGDRGSILETRVLERGVDFDDIVLAIPSAAHRSFAAELFDANPAYRRMVEHTHAVPTVAGQWWLSRSRTHLGWAGPTSIVTGLPGLFRTWADMTDVIAAENWAIRPKNLAYFCNVAPPEFHALEDPGAAARLVEERMPRWAETLAATAWPSTRVIGHERFDTGALHTVGQRAPWAVQYARANVRPWERYVLSIPGTMRHRLAPDESGFDNLWLAGDWTRNIINGGSVEGAVSSGITAARCIEAKAPGR